MKNIGYLSSVTLSNQKHTYVHFIPFHVSRSLSLLHTGPLTAECILSETCRRRSHSHAVEAVWRLFETVALSQVIINLAVFHTGVRGLAPSGDLPHGDPKRPLRDQRRGTEEKSRGVEICTSQTLAMEITRPCLSGLPGHPTLCTTYTGIYTLPLSTFTCATQRRAPRTSRQRSYQLFLTNITDVCIVH